MAPEGLGRGRRRGLGWGPMEGLMRFIDRDEVAQRLTYEVELVTTDGRLIEVDMNAATGEIVKLDEED